MAAVRRLRPGLPGAAAVRGDPRRASRPTPAGSPGTTSASIFSELAVLDPAEEQPHPLCLDGGPRRRLRHRGWQRPWWPASPAGCCAASSRAPPACSPTSPVCHSPSLSSPRWARPRRRSHDVLKDVGIDLYAHGFSISSMFGVGLVYVYFQIPMMVILITPGARGAAAAVAGGRREPWGVEARLHAPRRRPGDGAGVHRLVADPVRQRLLRLCDGARAGRRCDPADAGADQRGDQRQRAGQPGSHRASRSASR